MPKNIVSASKTRNSSFKLGNNKKKYTRVLPPPPTQVYDEPEHDSRVPEENINSQTEQSQGAEEDHNNN